MIFSVWGFSKVGQLENIRNYWNLRAEGYSESNMNELEDENRIRWVNTIMRYAPEKERLKILDIGCGPGFFSILMAQCGHDVTGVDYSDEMIAHAKENAEIMHQNIRFKRMDAQHLEFEDGTFDLVVTRNVTWVLEDPVQAYREMLRVLRHGGKIVNFDANHYLDRFDKDFADATVESRKAAEEYHREYIKGVDTNIIANIALELPLSKEKRPEWDFATLASLGAHKFDVELYDHICVQKESGIEFYAKSFVLSAQK